MSFFKNKHLLIATAMAPMLGLASYFGVNFLLSEKPLVAEAGQSYQLVEKSNCRYSSGICGLKNVDFELTLSFERLNDGQLLLKLESAHPLDGVMLALVENGTDEKQPVEMRPLGADGLIWSLNIARPDLERDRMHLVASSNGTLYFGDAAMKFMRDETKIEK